MVGHTDIPLPKSPPPLAQSYELCSGSLSPGAQKETDQELGLWCTPSGLPSFTSLGCCGDLADLLFHGYRPVLEGYFSNPRLVKGGRLTPHLSLLQTHTGRQVPLA